MHFSSYFTIFKLCFDLVDFGFGLWVASNFPHWFGPTNCCEKSL